MKIEAKELFEALKSVKFTEVSSLPVLNCVFFYVRDGQLELITTNLDNAKRAEILCINSITNADENWYTCVPMVLKYTPCYEGRNSKVKHKGYPLLDFVKTCDKDVLEFTLDKNIMTLAIDGENYHTTLKCIDGEEFPVGRCHELLAEKEIAS